MTIQLQDILLKLGDYARSYTTGNVDLGQRTRAVNEAIAYFQRRLGLPSDERVQSFYYVKGTDYYNLNGDYNEPVGIFYHDYQYNIPGNQFTYRKYPEILQLSGLNPNLRYFSFVTYNSTVNPKQLLIIGPNLNGGSILESFDNAIIEGWVGSGDANTLSLDPNIKTEGNNSLAFNITPNTGTATLKLPNYFSSAGSDFTNWLKLNAWFELDVYMASDNFEDLELFLQSSAGNYYSISDGGVQASGADYVVGQWNTVAFKFNDAIPVGSPVVTNINALQINLIEGVGFTQTNNMRVDNLRVVIPDYLDLIYYTNIKGKDGDSGEDIYNLANNTDTANFGDITPDLLDPIAKYGATIIMPQLRQDPNLRKQYLIELGIDPETMNDQGFIKMWGKVYPRKRIITAGRSSIRRGQSFFPRDSFAKSA